MGLDAVKTFMDMEGRSWNVRGTLGVFERIKTSTGVDMLDLATSQKCLEQISDVFTLGKVLYAACVDQCESRGISPESFADAFNADTLHAATDALLDEVIFFCRSDLRKPLEMALGKARAADAMAVESIKARMPEVEKRLDEAMVEMVSTRTKSATNLQAS